MLQIEIRVKGQINQQWSEWFGGLTLKYCDPDVTVLSGILLDEAALYGSFSRLRVLGLELLYLCCEEIMVGK